MDEILWCDHSHESSLPVLSQDAICLSNEMKMKLRNLLEICFGHIWQWRGLTTGLHRVKWKQSLDALYLLLVGNEEDLGGEKYKTVCCLLVKY